MRLTGDHDLATGAGLIACPRCDALHVDPTLTPGERLRCIRCAKLLASPRAGAFPALIALSLASMVLMAAAVFLPFLEISRFFLGNATSLFGVAMAASEGWLMPLGVGLLAMIVVLPVLRAALLVYVLAPLAAGRKPFRGAAAAFRLSEALRPWSMVDIFALGGGIALLKLTGMANVSLGPAFWAFCALIPVSIASGAMTSPATIWDAIERRGVRSDAGNPVAVAGRT